MLALNLQLHFVIIFTKGLSKTGVIFEMHVGSIISIKRGTDPMYAEEKLKIAMIELMETEPFSKITVTKLCQKSKVSRPTFYHHFSSLANLAFEAILYQTRKEVPDLDSWEDWLNHIYDVLIFMSENKKLFHHICQAGIHSECVSFFCSLLKKTIKRQETLLNYHLSPINESFVTRLYAETYLALLLEYDASNMSVDPTVITNQCSALLSDAVNISLRGFMRIEQA